MVHQCQTEVAGKKGYSEGLLGKHKRILFLTSCEVVSIQLIVWGTRGPSGFHSQAAENLMGLGLQMQGSVMLSPWHILSLIKH